MEDRKTFRVVQIKDSYGDICYMAQCRFNGLPSPLPWIEPSINMLYLECVSSYIFGNDFCSIISMSTLLEHVLRLALLDKENTGLKRNLSLNDLNEIRNISQAVDRALSEGLIDNQDKDWWGNIAKIIRNKNAHYIIPKLIKEFTKRKYDQLSKDREKYAPKWYRLTNENGLPVSHIAHDWGMFFHKVGYFIARTYLIDGTEHLKRILQKTNWEPDRSYWASQESFYNEFFSYNWNIDEMKKSLSSIYKDL